MNKAYRWLVVCCNFLRIILKRYCHSNLAETKYAQINMHRWFETLYNTFNKTCQLTSVVQHYQHGSLQVYGPISQSCQFRNRPAGSQITLYFDWSDKVPDLVTSTLSQNSGNVTTQEETGEITVAHNSFPKKQWDA